MKWILRPYGIEEVPCAADRTGAVVLEERTVQIVGAAFGDDVDDGTAIASVLSFVIRKHSQFRDRVQREDSCGIAEHASFVYRWIVAEAVVHVGTVKQEIV